LAARKAKVDTLAQSGLLLLLTQVLLLSPLLVFFVYELVGLRWHFDRGRSSLWIHIICEQIEIGWLLFGNLLLLSCKLTCIWPTNTNDWGAATDRVVVVAIKQGLDGRSLQQKSVLLDLRFVVVLPLRIVVRLSFIEVLFLRVGGIRGNKTFLK